MKLYHGSNIEIFEIDLSKSSPGKDFGKGFYLNPNVSQAIELAVSKSEFLGGEPIVSAFEFDEQLLDSSNLKIKIFEGYSEEWTQFIIQNRNNNESTPIHDYDIVIGPIADDRVGLQIRKFTQGYITVKKLIRELKFKEPAIQYFFGTPKAISLLKRIES